MSRSSPFAVDEANGRQLLLLRAFETDDAEPWTAADRDWATRVARASLGDGASPQALLLERTRHAMQRLAPRDAGVRAALAARAPFGPWLVAAVLLGLLAGVAVDQIGPAQRINLLAPPIWLLVLWNALVVLGSLLQPWLPALPMAGLRRWLQQRWLPRPGRSAALQRFAADWATATARLNAARAALLLHLAAAALGLGVLGGLYLRGLVLDYRAGWQSTFLDAAAVQAVLQALLAPATALTGIAVPDTNALALMQVAPGQGATAPAAPWLHLYAATLGLFVVGPRLLLAAVAGLRIVHDRRQLPLPLHEPWFQQALRPAGGLQGEVWLLPHAAPVPAAVALALQAALSEATQGRCRLLAAPPVAYGDEADPAACTPPPGVGAVLVLVDLASTPEAEVHGRLLDSVAAGAPSVRRLLVVDEAGYARRLGAADPRLDQRRQAWQALAAGHATPLLSADLGATPGDLAGALRQSLDR